LGHEHIHCAGRPVPASRGSRGLALVLVLTASYAVAEVIGSWISHSLALLADAGHMLTDIMALALALLAAWAARRPPDAARTYGYQRTEILAALVNGTALIVIAIFIFFEAWDRFQSPPEVEFRLMAIIAGGGLAVNVAGAWILGGHRHSLNVRAAYLHVLGDLLGSIGALVAAGLIGLFGWLWADPAASALIGCIIVFSAVRLVLASIHVLLEGVPSHLEIREVRDCLIGTPGVSDVHDLHLWSLAGESPLLTAHLVLDHSAPAETVLRGATRELRERFEITHSTLQIEPTDFNILHPFPDVKGGGDPERGDESSG
jgi:cobalt-zinc-cadmium efflux system protein